MQQQSSQPGRLPRRLSRPAFLARYVPKRGNKDFFVFDIETEGLGGDYIEGLVLWFDDDGVMQTRYCDTEEKLWNVIVSKQLRGKIGYAHNGAGYDFKYLLNLEDIVLPMGWEYHPVASAMQDIGMKLINQGKKRIVELHDFLKIAPAKLEVLTEKFDVAHKKLSDAINFDKENYDPKNPTHRQYLLHDCLGYYEVIQAFTAIWTEYYNTPLGWTTPASAMKAWKAKIPEGHVYFRMHSELRDYFRLAYYGGYNFPGFNRWKATPGTDEKIVGWDVNSMYPAMMLKGVPTGQPTFTRDYDPAKPGFYHVRAKVPDDTVMPILPYTDLKGRKYYPTGTFETYCASVEINRACELGYDIEVIDGYYFKKIEYVFDELINICMSIRQNPTYKGTVVEYIAKLVQNALYGKFGSNEEGIKYVVSLEQPKGDGWIHSVDIHTGEILENVWQRVEELDVPYLHPEWAAWITAMARIHLSYLAQQFAARDKLVYVDTDSVKGLVSTNDQIDVDEDPSIYGAWKREMESDEWYCAGPKTYTYHDIITDEWVVHSKGVPQKLVTHEMIKEASEGKTVTVKMNTMPSMSFLIKHDDRIQPIKQELRTLTIPQNVQSWKLIDGKFRPVKVDYEAENQQASDEYYQGQIDLYKKEEKETQQALYREIRKMGGIRPSSEWPDVPVTLRRKAGYGLDEIAQELGYEESEIFYEEIRKKY